MLNRYLPVAIIALLLACGLQASVEAWDGNWTQGRSGQGDVIYDKENSQGKAGTDPPQKFLTPPPREFRDVDHEELADYYKRIRKDYAPYAMARITQTIHYQGRVIPKGYYLIKAGDASDGSPRTNLQTLANSMPSNTLQTPAENVNLSAIAAANAPPAASTPPVSTPRQVGQSEAFQTLVIKQLGKVIAVVPIHRIEPYKKPRKQKLPRHALAWVEMEDRHPVLKFYYRKRIYSTDFQ